jgi:hypothetical protein
LKDGRRKKSLFSVLAGTKEKSDDGLATAGGLKPFDWLTFGATFTPRSFLPLPLKKSMGQHTIAPPSSFTHTNLKTLFY